MSRSSRPGRFTERWIRNSDALLAACLIGYAVVGKSLDLPKLAFILAKLFPAAEGHGRFPAIGVLAIELFLALRLFTQPEDRWARRYCATLFFGFAVVHFAILTDSSHIMECGCFGVLQGKVVAALFGTPLKALFLNLAMGLMLLRLDLGILVKQVQRITIRRE